MATDREKLEKLRGITRVGKWTLQSFGDMMREMPVCPDCGVEDCELWQWSRKSKPPVKS